MASVLRLRVWLVALMAVVVVAGCGDDGDVPASGAASTPAEVPDPSAEATAPNVEEIPLPAAVEARDVLFLTDSEVPVSKTVVDLYQKRAEEALGVRGAHHRDG